jgi:hypothetical protein
MNIEISKIYSIAKNAFGKKRVLFWSASFSLLIETVERGGILGLLSRASPPPPAVFYYTF